MATKPRFFDTDYYYHIYNVGVAKQYVFFSERDYSRFLDLISFYLCNQSLSYSHYERLDDKVKLIYNKSNPKGWKTLRVRFLAYCLMPNHFHFLLKPAKEYGITQFISDITNSHTRYINTKHERIGSLFQGTFKSKEIRTDESVLQVSRYIHLNPIFSSRTNPDGNLKKPEDYPFSSYKEWLVPKDAGLVDKKELSAWTELAGGILEYKGFLRAKIRGYPEIGIEDLVLE